MLARFCAGWGTLLLGASGPVYGIDVAGIQLVDLGHYSEESLHTEAAGSSRNHGIVVIAYTDFKGAEQYCHWAGPSVRKGAKVRSVLRASAAPGKTFDLYYNGASHVRANQGNFPPVDSFLKVLQPYLELQSVDLRLAAKQREIQALERKVEALDDVLDPGRLGDMRNPYWLAQRAVACRGAAGQSNPAAMRDWTRLLRLAGAWSAQYGFSLRELHLTTSRYTNRCAEDLTTVMAKLPEVVKATYTANWRQSRERLGQQAPVLETAAPKSLPQAAWCEVALTSGAQAIEAKPEQFGFQTATQQGKVAWTAALIRYRMTARAWQDRAAGLVPAGSYSAAEAERTRGAYRSWDRLLASSPEQSFWLSFVANEVSFCEKAGGKLPR